MTAMSAVAAAPILPDELLEHWGRVYLAHPRLRERGILFEAFVSFPGDLLRAVEAEGAAAACAVARMVAQGEVRRALDVDPLWRWRGHAYIEPLHHRRHVRGAARFPARAHEYVPSRQHSQDNEGAA